MTRAELIQRIQALTDDELERVLPFIEADLDLVADVGELEEELRRGRESARLEPLVDHEELLRSLRQLLD